MVKSLTISFKLLLILERYVSNIPEIVSLNVSKLSETCTIYNQISLV